MSQMNVQLARDGFQAVMRGELEQIEQLLHPDVRWHGGDPTAQGACQNRDQALAFMRRARRRGRVGELVDVIDAGDQVVVVMRPGDEPQAQLRANVTTFRDGKVIEMVAYETPEAALAAAGLAASES